MPETPIPVRTRGYKKKERTRRQLVEAGVRVLAARGDGLTVSDVVTEAEVSNGTFYNYFRIAKRSAGSSIGRFAAATMGILRHARRDETWARVMLRLVSRPGSGLDLSRYLSEDLDEGHARGRFTVGAEDAALDQVAGLVVMTMRRFVDGRAGEGAERKAVERGLPALGVDAAEASALAAAAEAAFAS